MYIYTYNVPQIEYEDFEKNHWKFRNLEILPNGDFEGRHVFRVYVPRVRTSFQKQF